MSLEMCFTKQKIGIALADRTADPTRSVRFIQTYKLGTFNFVTISNNLIIAEESDRSKWQQANIGHHVNLTHSSQKVSLIF